MTPPSRPAMRYLGGKWRIAQWIVGHFPNHRIYVEPFGGGGSVLLRKPRSYSEVYNDIDESVVNVFRVLRDRPDELRRVCALTPYARAEFELSYKPSDDPVENARRTIFRSFSGHASNAINQETTTGFRSNTSRSGSTPAQDWHGWPEQIPLFAERLRGVNIECMDYKCLLNKHDTAQTLWYVDPPYDQESRGRTSRYKHDFDEAEAHVELRKKLAGLAGMVVVSGYWSDLYRELYTGWRHVERNTHADGARDRVEVLWLSPNVRTMPRLFYA